MQVLKSEADRGDEILIQTAKEKKWTDKNILL